jgi:DNA (cytosine-5)-methyltransferase 1
VVREALPAAFVLENVAGLAFVDKDEGLKLLLEQVSHINKTEGVRYKPFCSILHGTQHGVPQQRDRLFVIALRDGAEFRFPRRAFAENGDSANLLPLPAVRTAWDALGDLPDFPATGEDLAISGKWASLLPTIPEGQNYLWHTARGGGEPLFGWRRRFWNFLLKLAKNRPAWTIAAQPGPATGPFHWKNRRLSMRELCRLQTFPDDVVIVGDTRAVQRQAGNAVPSLLTEIIGRELAHLLCGTSPSSAAPTLLPPKREPVPEPEQIVAVPSHFLRLRNIETAHPGTGKGYGASRRDVVDAERVRA